MIWACNPLGGQLSLRAVSKANNVTNIDTSFVYIDPMDGADLRAVFGVADVSYAKIVDFNNATKDSGLYSIDGRMEFWPITAVFRAALEA